MDAGEPQYFVIELKSRVQHVSDIVDQLQQGAHVVRALTPLRALLIHSGRVGTQELKVLARARISHAGKRLGIDRYKSGVNLADL